MGGFDLSRFATGGATRPDSFSGMQPAFRSALENMIASAPPDIRANFQIKSGYRSPERQAELWANALKKYGSPERARKWVAPPGNSQHNHGNAADLGYLSPDALKWAHANAGQYGLSFPLSNENWHIELANARGQNRMGAPAASPGVAVQPTSLAAAFAPAPGEPAPAMAATSPMMAAGIPDAGAQPGMGGLALMFAQQQADRRSREQDEQQAEQMRRAALFGQGGLAGLYGA